MNSVLSQQPIFSVQLIRSYQCWYQNEVEYQYQYSYSMNSYTGTDTDTSMKCHTGTDIEKYKSKNAAKRSRQHAGKKYREYAQRYVCFVNEQVPWPHSNINLKFCTSCLCMKMSSFLFVRAWALPRILYLSCGVPFPVEHLMTFLV